MLDGVPLTAPIETAMTARAMRNVLTAIDSAASFGELRGPADDIVAQRWLGKRH